jgi:hypothetical protein
MKVDLAGRIKNLDLPKSKPLLPLLEAISNSIDAIEEAKEPAGAITIRVLREESTIDGDAEGRALAPIIGFEITDNGEGFTNDNFDSFETCDSIHKQAKGAKGIGRLLWLKAFDDVSINSTYRAIDGKSYLRSFQFRSPEGVAKPTKPTEVLGPRTTTILLRGFKTEFEKTCPKKTTTIADRLIEHLASCFLNPKMAQITLFDDVSPEAVDLNQRFRDYFKQYGAKEEFSVGSHSFEIHHMRATSSDLPNHCLQLTAAYREVKEIQLRNRSAGLGAKLVDEAGQSFTYVGIVSGILFTERVSPNRTNFDLPEESELDLGGYPTLEEILKVATEKSVSHLSPFLEKVRAAALRDVRRVVDESYPEYKGMLSIIESKVDEFAPNSSPEQIARKINELQFEAEQDSRKEAEVLKKPQAKDSEEYRARYRAYLDRVTTESQARLAQYVAHRRTILDLLAERIKLRGDDKYPLEEEIHELIFPVKTTSDTPGVWGHQNLWLVDERLAYHGWLASDVPLKSQAAIASNSAERPDLVIMNRPGVFSADDEIVPLQSVTIVELKRPGRMNFRQETKDPIEQVLDYIKEIRAGHVKDRSGRVIKVTDNTPFFAYLICDMEKDTHIEQLAQRYLDRRTADGLGFYGYNQSHNAYFEIIPFDKLVRDARQRNQAFFKALGISERLSHHQLNAAVRSLENKPAQDAALAPDSK